MNKTFELAQNKKIVRKYKIYDKYDCGMVLDSFLLSKILGHDFSFSSTYGWIKNNEIFLRNFYQEREVKLLLHKSEIRKIIRLVNEKKYSIIPVKLFLKNHKVKVELALAKYDKNFEDNKHKFQKLKLSSWKKLNLKEVI